MTREYDLSGDTPPTKENAHTDKKEMLSACRILLRRAEPSCQYCMGEPS